MYHLGDICKINGAEIEAVDVITAGSPCQDLSVAGKRAGLEGERSGLFMEQIRIIKEMRNADKERGRADDAVRPRYLIWENVPGSLSSAGKGMPKGADFQAVLTEIVKIVQPTAPDVPMPDKGGVDKTRKPVGSGRRWNPLFRGLETSRCTVLGCSAAEKKNLCIG